MKTTDYNKQAEDFLQKHGIKFRATLSDSKPAPWELDEKPFKTEPHHFRVTLSRSKNAPELYQMPVNNFPQKTRPPRLVFDFWSSIADAEKGIKTVTAYDVLACISGDMNCPETFKDFCGDYGYEEDSIKALQTFRRCASFGKRLRAFFTPQEIEELSEIQ